MDIIDNEHQKNSDSADYQLLSVLQISQEHC